MKDDCIFCKIANGMIPSKTLYEDDDFKVILDVGPATKGHALVLPKEHYSNLFEMPENLLSKVLVVAQKEAQEIKETLKPDGLNLVQNNGAQAGQTVNHFHLHIIPRYEGDNQRIGWRPTEPSMDELETIKNAITRNN